MKNIFGIKKVNLKFQSKHLRYYFRINQDENDHKMRIYDRQTNGQNNHGKDTQWLAESSPKLLDIYD